jgi:two-component system osmolarity sensor histidine kinase EnvZ
MLAGVSHDLRTPLTRLRLQIEMLDGAAPEDVADIKEDVDEMERMLDGYLAFARGEGDEQSEPTNLNDLLNDIHRRFRHSKAAVKLEVTDLGEEHTTKPIAIRRCLSNLIGNAIRYGSRVDITARRTGARIEINVDDDGPGIAEDQRENVFKAFYRVDASRNPETGGVGLGLTIARDIARSLGGDVTLGQNEMGGLRSTVRFPV